LQLRARLGQVPANLVAAWPWALTVDVRFGSEADI